MPAAGRDRPRRSRPRGSRAAARTTSPMPSASRAHGERICRVGVLAGLRLLLGGPLLRRRGRPRGPGPASGEVFVGTYTSMITGRITGLRWVTS